MTHMIEQVGLTLHILVTNLVTLGMYQGVSFVTTYCTSDCYIYWMCFQNLEMRNMTGGCLESFTPINKNFA